MRYADIPEWSTIWERSSTKIVDNSLAKQIILERKNWHLNAYEGQKQDAATTAITGAKLMVGTVTPQSSDKVDADTIISQDPTSGSSVAQGSRVNLVISSGQK